MTKVLHISSIEINTPVCVQGIERKRHGTCDRDAHPPLAGRSTPATLFATASAAPFAVWRQRRALASLPDHLRQDVGLTEADDRPRGAPPHLGRAEPLAVLSGFLTAAANPNR
jgi:uncharacterized protein YjiS (DUF1127 family)